MMCKCRAEINKRLKESNGRLATGFLAPTMELAPLFIEVEKINTRSRTKPPHVLASFCPFCGEKIKDAAASSL